MVQKLSPHRNHEVCGESLGPSFWIGLQLGVKPKSLLAALDTDPLAHELVLAD